MKHCLSPVPFLTALALIAACERQEGQPTIYAPTAVGTTLLFEAFELENGVRPNDRLQLRVLQAKRMDDGLEVTYDYSTLQGNTKATFLCKQDGGIFKLNADGSKDIQLPPGFPDKATSWQSNRATFQVLGRAKANLEGIELYDPIGVWVEATTISSPPSFFFWVGKARILFLPGIGEAEIRVLHKGSWVTVRRLVGVGASAESM
ncbi:MAG: hypothetical protein LBC63_03780 [Holophagales bacterium]|jgi:hypothetical protein|nr:hypothetical protein [Holophagales bacterium]